MTELSDKEREQAARDRARIYAGEQLGMAGKDRELLLRLLDVERARADAAESQVAQLEAQANFWASR